MKPVKMWKGIAVAGIWIGAAIGVACSGTNEPVFWYSLCATFWIALS
jgi:hypothetical protein